MSRDAAAYLLDMLEACERIARYTANADRPSLLDDTKTIDALIRNLAVLGEAAKRVPEPIRPLAPDVPWRAIAGMRDVLVHDYFWVDETIVIDAVFEHVPRVRVAIERVARGLGLST